MNQLVSKRLPGMLSALLRWANMDESPEKYLWAPDCHLPCWDEQIWMKIQRNTYEPSPKLEVEFVPNWRLIEKRHFRLEYQTKTRLSSCQELVFVCGYPLMCPTPVVSLHFLREIWLKSQFDHFRGFVLPPHFLSEAENLSRWRDGIYGSINLKKITRTAVSGTRGSPPFTV